MQQSTKNIVDKIDRFAKNSRTNPIGWLRLNLEDAVTLKYVEAGFFVDENGYIHDTLFWPGDSVVNTKIGIAIPTDIPYEVTKVSWMGKYSPTYRYDLTGYLQKGASHRTNVYRAKIHPRGYSVGYSASNFKINGNPKNTMLSLEQKKPTLVIEVTETLVDNVPVLTEVGNYEKFESIGAARAFVATKIRDAVRQRNAYPSYRIYAEDSVAVAEEPPIVFK
jgi:hypothetical protein